MDDGWPSTPLSRGMQGRVYRITALPVVLLLLLPATWLPEFGVWSMYTQYVPVDMDMDMHLGRATRGAAAAPRGRVGCGCECAYT